MRFLNFFLALTLFAPLLQDESVTLTAPAEGQTVSGVVVISGAAASPQFQRYELEFAYEPNPTDAWFPIQDPTLTPQPGGALGQWNTAGISDGVYLIRLRLYRLDGSFAEAFIHNVLLSNGMPTPPGPATPVGATAPAEATSPAPTATGAIVELPPTSTPRPTATAGAPSGPDTLGPTLSLSTFARSFVAGIGWAVVAFLVMGAYGYLRPMIRPRLRRLIRDLLRPR